MVRKVVAWIVGLAMAANGVVMLAIPATWYGLVPGVADSGPLNVHFVRDIGCAYLVSGGSLIWLGCAAAAWPAALAGAAFLAAHALVHLSDAAAGRESLGHLMRDLPSVFAPAVLAVWLAWPRRPVRR